MKRIVLILCGGYLPGYKSGGPVRSIANLVESIGDEFDFRIITLDRDLESNGPYPGIKVDTWQRVGKAEVFYLSPHNVILYFLRRLINSTEHDILYLNSFFSPGFTVRPLLLRRLGLIPHKHVIIAPRGEFSVGALKIKKFKKKVYIFLASILGLYHNVLWQASSKHEKDDILNVFNKAHVYVASIPMIVMPIDERTEHGERDKKNNCKKSGILKAVFLSRISPKKNLDSALMMLRGIRGVVTFNIFGPLEDESYWEKCRGIIDESPTNIQVRYKGSIGHDAIDQILSTHDLFFFPTYGENFGHVIIESLIAGCPILISDQTPWRDLETAGVGWDLPLDQPDKFTKVLQHCVDMGNNEWQTMSKRAREYGIKIATDEKVIQQNRDLFNYVSITKNKLLS